MPRLRKTELVAPLNEVAARGRFTLCIQRAEADDLPTPFSTADGVLSYYLLEVSRPLPGILLLLHTTSGAARGFTLLCQSLGARLVEAAEPLLSAAFLRDTLNEELQRANADARRDPLTGLANRLAWNEALESTSVTPESPVTVMQLDCRGLKRINDTYGHGGRDGRSSEPLVEERRGAEAAAGLDREVGDLADADPPFALVEPLGVAPSVRVEDEQRLAAIACHLLDGREQRCPDSAPPATPVDEHLREVGPVRLVLRLCEHELNGADDTMLVLGDEERAPAFRNVFRDPTPEPARFLRSEGVEEADTGPALDRVDQHCGEPFEPLLVDLVEPTDAHVWVVHVSAARPARRP